MNRNSAKMVPWPADVSPTLNAHFGSKQGLEDQHVNGGGDYLCQPVANCLTQRMYKGINTTLDEGQTPIVTIGGGFDVAQPIPYDLYQITAPVNRQNRKPGDPCHTLARDNAAHAAVAIQGTLIGRGENAGPQGSGADASGAMFMLTKTDVHAVAMRESGQGYWMEDNIAGTIDAYMGMSGHANRPAVIRQSAMQVRRLTPVECERLQGFPDGYTNIPWRGKPESPDGPRYKALGNSMAVPCMVWIGERINKVEAL